MPEASGRFIEVSRTGIHALLGVEPVEVSATRVELRMPVGPAVHQPFGLLHGGVSALLAESAASIGGAAAAAEGFTVVGIELNANHVRSMRDGVLTAVALPVSVGRRIQVWTIDLTDQDGRTICVSRCTLAVIELPDE
ncbi:MAG TPA: hotdog fold thioesterase [Acidimicrobiales bacterium]|nr:hotdog fold thioesterase [Acidimicrobiales bacterium]